MIPITAKQIKAARGLLDWGQEDLAKASGLAVKTVRTLENADSDDFGRLFRSHFGRRFRSDFGRVARPFNVGDVGRVFRLRSRGGLGRTLTAQAVAR